jgi:hypothetical protein
VRTARPVPHRKQALAQQFKDLQAAGFAERCEGVRIHAQNATHDTDFGTLLPLSGVAHPGGPLRRRPGRRVEQRVAAVSDALAAVGDALEEGALVVVEPDRIRVRELPIGSK